MILFDPELVHVGGIYADKNECLETMVGWLHEKHAFHNKRVFLRDLLDRESIMPTGIGRGVALPHARSEAAAEMCVAVCVLGEGLEWQSLDGKPVRIVVLVSVPGKAGREYMQFMQAISEFCRHEENRRALLMAGNDEDAYHLLQRIELHSEV